MNLEIVKKEIRNYRLFVLLEFDQTSDDTDSAAPTQGRALVVRGHDISM